MYHNRKPSAKNLPPVSMGGVAVEELPFSIVHYPGHYGTFFAFSKDEASEPYLCECSMAAVTNYLELRKIIRLEDSEARAKLTDERLFPRIVQGAPVRFKSNLCHRCNMTPPSMRYCVEMYGTRFVQAYGWYINQAYLRFGIVGSTFLEGVTPSELVDCVLDIREADKKATEAYEWFRVQEPLGLPGDHEAPSEEELGQRRDVFRSAQMNQRRAHRALEKKIENVVRAEFGFRKVGERWISETLLYNIVLKLYPEQEVLRHHRPEWLEGLELDIFIPDLGLGLEYQGQQHYHPVEAWGGEKALADLQVRDDKKATLCQELGIHLVAIDYTEPLTIDHIRSRIESSQSVGSD